MSYNSSENTFQNHNVCHSPFSKIVSLVKKQSHDTFFDYAQLIFNFARMKCQLILDFASRYLLITFRIIIKNERKGNFFLLVTLGGISMRATMKGLNWFDLSAHVLSQDTRLQWKKSESSSQENKYYWHRASTKKLRLRAQYQVILLVVTLVIVTV